MNFSIKNPFFVPNRCPDIFLLDGKLLAEYNGLGECMRDYIYLGDRLLAEYQPQTGQIYYYTSDQVNSTRVVTDQNGVRVFAAVYDPYGGIQKIWENSYSPAMKFSGKERDTESNLDYFGARYYGNYYYRWLSPDPVINKDAALTNPQLWNLYAFCHNSPVTYWDLDGRKEGSLRNIWTRIKINYIALSYDQSTMWARDVRKDNFASDSWKCNKFVFDVAKEAGARAEVAIGQKSRAPLASEWADRNVDIPGWRVLEAGETAMAGDVFAYKNSGESGTTGHTGFMIVGQDGELINLSAHEETVHHDPNQFLNRSEIAFRRYVGEGRTK